MDPKDSTSHGQLNKIPLSELLSEIELRNITIPEPITREDLINQIVADNEKRTRNGTMNELAELRKPKNTTTLNEIEQLKLEIAILKTAQTTQSAPTQDSQQV